MNKRKKNTIFAPKRMNSNKGQPCIIFTADDFGLSEEANFAVLKGIKEGFLTSTCICANGRFYNHAFDEVLPKIPNVDLGVHLNIIEGNSLIKHKLLANNNGEFNHGYVSLLINSYKKNFLKEIEAEFRAQIEKTLESAKKAGLKINFLNSHVHTHSIPKIFELACKLAKEYEIPSIRTQAEKIYIARTRENQTKFEFSEEAKYKTKSYFSGYKPPKPLNLIKAVVLNYFTIINRAKIKKLGLKTNSYIIGVCYTGEMDKNTIFDGLNALKNFNNFTVEILIHPEINSSNTQRNREFLTTIDADLKKKIQELGFRFGSF